MQQFLALFKKEMNGYFRSNFLYFIFFIYLFVSVGGAFYFGSYLAMHDVSVYALFYLQPIILTILIPALTMRLWSDEYKSGTAEFLLTQPISDKIVIFAKFAAAGFFAIMMSLFLLPFIFYTSAWLKIDWSNVFCEYLGTWLFILLFCALGCFISSLSKYTIISYLLTVFCSGLWLLMSQTRLYDIYGNFLFAEVGISDFAYFISFTAAIVFLNILVPGYVRSAHKNKNLRFFGFSLLFIAGIVALNTAFAVLFDDYKADFTSEGKYTLNKTSRSIISSVTKPLYIDVYISKDLKSKNADYYYHYQQATRFIKKYQQASSSMITVNTVEVEPFSEMEKIVLKAGLYYEENLKGTKDYFGAIIRDNEGQGEVIKQFLPQRQKFLEKDIDKTLLKLTNKDVIKSIGVYFDPRQNLDLFNGFSLDLEEDYNVLNVTENTYEISPKLDLLILVNPKEFSVSFLYAIDQYIANGGKILIFLDLLTDGQSEGTNLKTPQAIVFMDQMNILLGENFVDSGNIADEYRTNDGVLNLYKALTFKVKDEKVNIRPIISNDNGYVGAIISGQYKSAFEQNPHQSKEIIHNMMPHTFYSSETPEIALIGDADIIEDKSWIDDASPDSNPYSVIYKSANMSVIRQVIDEMVGNDIYNELSPGNKYGSSLGIGEQINSELYDEYADEYNDIKDEIKLNNLKLLQKSDGDENKLQILLQSDELGLQLGKLEQRSEELLYKLRKQYSEKINTMIFLWVLLWPLLVGLLMRIAVVWREKCKSKQIKEMFYE